MIQSYENLFSYIGSFEDKCKTAERFIFLALIEYTYFNLCAHHKTNLFTHLVPLINLIVSVVKKTKQKQPNSPAFE